MTQQKSDTALLILDMQEQLLNHLPGGTGLLPSVSKAIATAREQGIPVIYVVVGFREGFPEIHPGSKSLGNVPATRGNMAGSAFMKITPSLAPEGSEVVVIKKRYSAFAGSDLEIILRSKSIRHLVLCGVVTSGVVLYTLTEAADKDYRLTVLSDGCLDRDDAVHRVLMEKVFPRAAEVLRCEEWVSQYN